MRSRLYALSFVDHSSYSNFHATGFRKIDNYQASFTTFVSATLWVHFCAQDLQDLSIIETILFKKDFVLSILVWIFVADFFLNVSPSRVLHGFTYSFVDNVREGVILNALKAPVLLRLFMHFLPIPWIN